jgi:hypothetical protein
MYARFLAVGVIAVLMVTRPALSVPQDGETSVSIYAPDGLKGLAGVYVLVEDVNREAEADRLRREEIQTDVELKLRQSGIQGLTYEEALKTPGLPQLSVIVNAMKTKDASMYAYTASVELLETVTLQRNPKIKIGGASTWKTPSIVGVIPASRVSDLRADVKDMVDKFCNAWLTANPKK